MNYREVLENARKVIGPNCKACPVCNGLACGNIKPGPGSKAPGNGANDNYKAWRTIKLNMDAIVPNTPIDTTTELFGRTLGFPLLTAPIGSIAAQYNPTDDIRDELVDTMYMCGARSIAEITPDMVRLPK